MRGHNSTTSHGFNVHDDCFPLNLGAYQLYLRKVAHTLVSVRTFYKDSDVGRIHTSLEVFSSRSSNWLQVATYTGRRSLIARQPTSAILSYWTHEKYISNNQTGEEKEGIPVVTIITSPFPRVQQCRMLLPRPPHPPLMCSMLPIDILLCRFQHQ